LGLLLHQRTRTAEIPTSEARTQLQNVLEALDVGSPIVDAEGDKDCIVLLLIPSVGSPVVNAEGDKDCIVLLLSPSAEMGDSVGTKMCDSVGTKDTRKEEGGAVLLLVIGDEDTGEKMGADVI
jgi:hypothetical protein